MSEAQTADKTIATTKPKGLKAMLEDVDVKKRFEEMLGGRDARSFQSNILTVYNGAPSLQKCEPGSIIAAAAISASVNLSILPSLGQSCIVPYEDKERGAVAQWQIMWKGVVQLAHRTGQYKRINLAHVYEGQLIEYDEFKGIVKLDASKKKSGKVEGYFFYFELTNGYAHEAYWSARKCIEHGLRFSKSFQRGGGKWAEDPRFKDGDKLDIKKWLKSDGFLTEDSGADSMSAKSIVKNVLLKWGPLETRIKEVIAQDQAVITPEGKVEYIDSTTVDTAAAVDGKTYEMPKMTKDEPEKAAEVINDRARFFIHSVGSTSRIEGEPATVIKSTIANGVYYTRDEGVKKFAEKAMKEKFEVDALLDIHKDPKGDLAFIQTIERAEGSAK